MNAAAVAFNFTVVSPTGPGTLTVSHTQGSIQTSFEFLNFASAGPAVVRSSGIDFPVSDTGEISATADVAGNGTVHLIVNAYGYFE